jgi:putative membrane-bound dehydrogenase-like protein
MFTLTMCLTLAAALADPAPGIAQPRSLDSRLKITLFAAEPDIVTPCGLAVDARGRVLVVESHTHFPPEGYQGPTTDRIRLLQDTNGDGRADRIDTFFDGTTWTMNIGVHPDGSVYVATRSEVFRLRDTDDDGRADQRVRIAHLETEGDYPHDGLSGFTFDFAGNVYFGLGENKGAEYRLVGSDGSMASELEGGQIYRCRADGTRVELIALGFWNPFHLAFDAFGRLFAVDNDPDSLPPCRLMHIVEGGNYGYRYRNGRRGVHPFTAWNGELPGTLPMVAGTGEAPSGLVVYESDQLPADYVGDLMATSWGDHRIDRFHLETRGASFRADGKPVIQGDENFRPVGIATAPDGSLLVSDWVLKDYQVHGKGRIWHITSKEPKPAARPERPSDAIGAVHRPLREQAARALAAGGAKGREELRNLAGNSPLPRARAAALSALALVGDFDAVRAAALADRSVDVQSHAIRLLPADSIPPQLFDAAASEVRAEAMRRAADRELAARLWRQVGASDAFVAEAARQGLARSHAVTAKLNTDWDAAQRLAALLVLREWRVADGETALPALLRDTDPAVRFAAIQWVGEARLRPFRDDLHAALAAGPATGRLFAGYLAALERLDGVVRTAEDEWAGEQYIVRALEDKRTPSEVMRWSLRMLRPNHPLLSIDRLRSYLASDDEGLRLEAVRSLRDSPLADKLGLLCEIAASTAYTPGLRSEAVVGISAQTDDARSLLVDLAATGPSEVRPEALRSLRGAKLNADQRARLAALAQSDANAAELVERVLNPQAVPKRPAGDDLSGWLKLVYESADARPGDAAAGERIFFHSQSAACARCHQIGGRGARIGPELTAATGPLSRERLLESIVRPSKEIAPQFTTWLVVTTSGKTHTGVLVKELATGEQTYADAKGELIEFKPGEIATRHAQSTSVMPDGLPQLMTAQELRDLMAFLQADSRQP